MKEETQKLLHKAERAVGASECLLARGDTDFAVARSYYVMLYAADALLCEKGLSFFDHAGSHAAFEEHFVRCGLIDPKYHRWLVESLEIRITADYSAEADFTVDETRHMIERAREFLTAARRHLEHAAA